MGSLDLNLKLQKVSKPPVGSNQNHLLAASAVYLNKDAGVEEKLRDKEGFLYPDSV